MPSGLLTDLYELNMAAAYLRTGMTGPATFSLFVRRLPRQRGFLIAAGLEDCLAFLESFAFTDADLAWLADTQGFTGEDVAAFRRLRFTGDVWAMPEGTAVFADEPFLEVTAPAAEAQLVETGLLNHITFQTSVATKAARCVLAADDADIVDFAFRRTQGIEAGLAAARASAIAGFSATSNAEAARRYGLTAAGTMAHSFIEAFGTEQEAFATFAAQFPRRTTFLVDTYDTEQGIRAAIDVITRLRLPGPIGVRLDSGDLAALAFLARRMLDQAGLAGARIFASGGLDEYAIAELRASGAPIDVYGVGTKMGVSADAPYLDSAYKLVQFGDRPVMKLSEGKATLPGAKQVHRSGTGDVIALRDEAPPPGYRELLRPVMLGGARTGPPESLAVARQRCAASLGALPASALSRHDASAVPVAISPALAAVRDRLASELATVRRT
jgi:nicotinate phosphoribosyltransferase